MGDLSPHFSTSEFRCHGFGRAGHPTHRTIVSDELVRKLELVRGAIPLRIISGHRCAWWNRHRLVNGAPRSFHVKGMAADIESGRLTKDRAVALGFRGIGLDRHGWAVHVDVRTGPVTIWRYR